MLASACAAILCGAQSFDAVAQWAQLQNLTLMHRLGFTRRPPTAGSYRYLFLLLDVAAFEEALRRWAEPLLPAGAA